MNAKRLPTRSRTFACACLSAICAALLWVTLPAAAFADGTSSQQTAVAAHATEEQANCLAQGRCPSATPVPTDTPVPTSTPRPVPSATPTSVPDAPSPTPLPALPLPRAGGNPVGGYLRPSDLAPGDFELALREGRWDIALADGCAAPLTEWQNVWLLVTADGLPVLAGPEYFTEYDASLLCPLVGATWASDSACAQDDDGRCDVATDASYWQTLADQQAAATSDDPPAASAAPTTEPTARVITRVVQAPAPPPPPAQVVYQEGPTPPPQVITVYSTVLVYAPTSTPIPTSTPAPSLTPTEVATLELWTPQPIAAPSVEPPDPSSSSTQPQFGVIGTVLGAFALLALMVWRRNANQGDV